MANIIGIDVSENNGSLDWAKIKAAGIQFAIIRSGYGTSHVDNCFKANMEGALAQNIPIGIYHFSYALNTAGAEREADFVLRLLKPYQQSITLPVFYDFEYDTIRYAKEQGVTLGKAAFNAHTLAFCDRIKSEGYRAGAYYNLDFLNQYVDTAQLAGLFVWYAQYASTPSISEYAIWQYTSSFSISGISGRFDANILKDTSLLDGGQNPEKPGWKEEEGGWRYDHADGSYSVSAWEQIDGKWYYFDKEGYRLENQWGTKDGQSYYFGAGGAVVANKTLKLGTDGKLVPAGDYYYLLRDVPSEYRSTLDKLIAMDVLRGRSGSGDDLVLDMSEDAVRVLVILSRAGVFDES